MFQVVVAPPEDVVAALEPFRRLHDPAFHRHPPHIALTPTFDAADGDALLQRFLTFRGPSVLVTFDGPRTEGSALVLPVLDEAGRVAALGAAVREAVMPAPARALAEAIRPSLRIGHFATDAERELARRAFTASGDGIPAFIAKEATLLVEDVRGLWHGLRTVELLPPGA